MATTLPKLADLYPATEGKDIQTTVKAFDLSTINATDPELLDHLHVALAPSFGACGSPAACVKGANEACRLSFGTATESMVQIVGLNVDFETAADSLLKNPFLRETVKPVLMKDTIDCSPAGLLSKGKDSIRAHAEAAYCRLVSLIPGKDALARSGLQADMFLSMIDKVADVLNHVKSLPPQENTYVKTLVDIAFMQYPDAESRYIKLHAIRIDAYASRAGDEIKGGLRAVYRGGGSYRALELLCQLDVENLEIYLKAFVDANG